MREEDVKGSTAGYIPNSAITQHPWNRVIHAPFDYPQAERRQASTGSRNFQRGRNFACSPWDLISTPKLNTIHHSPVLVGEAGTLFPDIAEQVIPSVTY